MEWAFVILIVGAMAYAGMIVMEYTNRAIAVRPMIAKLENESLDLLDQINNEASDHGERKNRIGSIRDAVAGLSSGMASLNRDLQIERTRKQRLEIEYYKLQLKGKLRKAAA